MTNFYQENAMKSFKEFAQEIREAGKEIWNDIAFWRKTTLGLGVTALGGLATTGFISGGLLAELENNKEEIEACAEEWKTCEDNLSDTLHSCVDMGNVGIDIKDELISCLQKQRAALDTVAEKMLTLIELSKEQTELYQEFVITGEKLKSCQEKLVISLENQAVCLDQNTELAIAAETYKAGMEYTTERWAEAQQRDRGHEAQLAECERDRDAYRTAEGERVNKRISFK